MLEGRHSWPGGALRSAAREVKRFYASGMDVRTRNRMRFRPIATDLRRVDAIRSLDDVARVLARWHSQGVHVLFSSTVYPDRRRSRVYAFYLEQGGLSLPDRDYYLGRAFARHRREYLGHLRRMFRLLGESVPAASHAASRVLRLETAMASASRSQTALRDVEKNYHKMSLSKLRALTPALRWGTYLAERGARRLPSLIVGQPEFFAALERLLRRHSLDDWKTYFRWHVLRSSAPYLHHAVDRENFRFFHRTLRGQRRPEPMWKRTLAEADHAIGDSLGRLFVRDCFPRPAAARMARLVRDLRAVFRDRLRALAWMTPATRRKALAKFERFRTKIGHPRRYRDDAKLRIVRNDYLGNVRRAAEFESRRRMARIGRPVNPDEWRMTPPMVNAYFDATQNEIVFPAGILQPPFFDPALDDAVNYGAIGVVIGHEITHGYDDQGRRYDQRGNLRDWWTPRDAREFRRRANQVVALYNSFEALPGAHVQGALTVGENIADLGGVSIAFEALQRRLRADPARARPIDGWTPAQRFFLSYAQIWRQNIRPEDARRHLVIDPHAPGRFRVIGAVMNSSAFFDAFPVRAGDSMFRPERARIQIW